MHVRADTRLAFACYLKRKKKKLSDNQSFQWDRSRFRSTRWFSIPRGDSTAPGCGVWGRHDITSLVMFVTSWKVSAVPDRAKRTLDLLLVWSSCVPSTSSAAGFGANEQPELYLQESCFFFFYSNEQKEWDVDSLLTTFLNTYACDKTRSQFSGILPWFKSVYITFGLSILESILHFSTLLLLFVAI